MHMTHAILVELDQDMEALSDYELCKEARVLAESATEDYADHAFDWRHVFTDEEARGEGLPGAVVLGRNERNFQRLLDEWANMPWHMMLAHFKKAKTKCLDENYLKSIWEEREADLATWPLTQALRLVTGEYLIDSGCYSVPDTSPKLSEETRAEIRAHPERFALVFFDYHW
jgi:hypothetical protein